MAVRIAVPLLLSLLSFAAPASSDWLVTRDGTRMQTRGPWQVKGSLVVFTKDDGTLVSLRLSGVDLEASRQATAAAAAAAATPAPPPRPAAEKKKPVLVLTDADVPRARKPEPQAEEPPAEEEAAPQVGVVSWSEINDPDDFDVQILGTLRNDTQELATDLGVGVQLFADDGTLLAEVPALLLAPSLPPGASTNFQAAFPGVYSFSTVTFQVTGNHMRFQKPLEEAAEPPPQTP